MILMLGLVKVLAFLLYIYDMEKQQKKQIMKYIYFLCMGLVIGFLLGSVSRHDYYSNKQDKVVSYEVDTVTSENGWYGNYEWVEITGSGYEK